MRKHSALRAQRSALWHRLWPWPKGHAGRVWPRCANDAGTSLRLNKWLPTLFKSTDIVAMQRRPAGVSPTRALHG